MENCAEIFMGAFFRGERATESEDIVQIMDPVRTHVEKYGDEDLLPQYYVEMVM